MARRNKAVIFDVDGTLLNPEEGVCAAVKYVIAAYGLSPLSHEELLAFNGPPIQKSLSKHYPLEPEQIQKLAEAFRQHYKEHELYQAKIYPGIYEVMKFLVKDGFKIGIATYKRQDYAKDLMRHFHFDTYAEAICGADNYNQLKKTDIVKNCLKKLNVISENAVMVGDSDNDAVAAAELGMDFLGVTYGFGFAKEEDTKKYQPIGCAKMPSDIYSFIKKRYGGK